MEVKPKDDTFSNNDIILDNESNDYVNDSFNRIDLNHLDERSSIETSDKSCKNTPDQITSTNHTDFNTRISGMSGTNLNNL